MNIEVIRNALFWCAAINYFLLLWFAMFKLARQWMLKVYANWFHLSLSPEQFDTLHIGRMLLYKLEIVVFNFVPAIALLIVG